jgi:SAM-dependent methyltransferase
MDNPEFYEQFDWANMSDKHIAEKAKLFLSVIPADVKTILDVGCGNGAITNFLASHFEVTGVDRSAEALKFVKTSKIQCSCDDMPFRANSFDLVLSSEMLEHLEDKIYSNTINEIRRVSKKYILISVPDQENLERDMICCPYCGFTYNKNYHLRSIGKNDLVRVMTGYKLKRFMNGGSGVRSSFGWLTRLKHQFAPTDSWIPTYWTKKRSRQTLCPSCNTGFEIPFRQHPVSFIYDVITFVFSKPRPYWLIAFFEKI